MKRVKLGGKLEVGRIGLGAMGMSAFYTGANENEAESVRTLHRSLDLGANFIDTAEAYGPYTNEELVGRAYADRRDQVVLATKFRDSRPDSVRSSLDGSLKRLGVDHIDLYYQHHPSDTVPIEDTVGVMAEAVAAGKILHVGLSNADAETIRRAHAVHPITALQSEYSLWTRDCEHDGVLAVLRELGIGFVPFSPLGHGIFTGKIRSTEHLADYDFRKNNPRFTGENFQRNLRIVDEIEVIAKGVGATPAQVALAWLLHQGDDIAPIPGTKSVTRLEENCAADAVELSVEQLDQLANLTPASGNRLP